MFNDKRRVLYVAIFFILLLLPAGYFLAFNKTATPTASPSPTPSPTPRDILLVSSSPSSSASPTATSKTTTKPTTTPKTTPKTTTSVTATPAPTSGSSNSSSSSNNSSSTQTTTTTATPAPTVNSSIVTLSTTSLNVTMNRGETKSNLFSFTSTGATGFTLYGYPTTYGPGINWTVATGGLVNGSTINAGISVSSNVPTGTYTGTGILKFDPGNVQKTMNITVTVVEPPASSLGYTFSADSVNISIKNGESQNVFSFTSTGSTGFSFYGYPTTFGPGINWGVSTGGSQNGQTTQQSINIVNVPPGTYTGTAKFTDTSSGAEKNIPVTVTVTE